MIRVPLASGIIIELEPIKLAGSIKLRVFLPGTPAMPLTITTAEAGKLAVELARAVAESCPRPDGRDVVRAIGRLLERWG